MSPPAGACADASAHADLIARHLARGFVPAEALIDRIEEAVAVVQMPVPLWERFLALILPELFEEPPRQPCPCQAQPATEAKLRVLERRAEEGQRLHHDADPRWDDDRLEHHPHAESGEAVRTRDAALCRRTHAGAEVLEPAPGAATLTQAGQPWTEEELALLGVVPDEQLARMLGRARTAIAVKRLKVKEARGGATT